MRRRVFAFIVLLPFILLFASPSAPAKKADDAFGVGFGETDITPNVGGANPVFVAGFGPNRKATGIHDRLMARAIVLAVEKKKVAIVSVDLVGFFLTNVENVRKQLDGFDYVLVTSTHNHEGPDTLGLWGPTPLKSGVDPDYMKLVEKQIVAAIKAADAARKPVKARCGTIKAPELLHDGREPYVLHDELTALEFRDPASDKLTGIVVQWNCHPETLDSKNTLISADYVGYTVEHLKKRYGCPVVYLTGTVGGLMTSLHVEVKDGAGKPLADGTYEKTERFGQLVGAAAEKALTAAKDIRLTPIEVKSRSLLPIDNKLYLAGRQLGVFEREAFLWAGNPDKAEPVKNADPKRLCMRTEIALLRFGDLEAACIPGEIYPELVLSKVQDPIDPGADFPDAPIEPGIYTAMRSPQRMLIGLANDEIGYIIPKRQWDEKAPFCYGGRKKAQYGEGNSLGPETAPLLCESFKKLVGK